MISRAENRQAYFVHMTSGRKAIFKAQRAAPAPYLLLACESP
jgi:hypothetical protein